jgi:hypothetical protein
MDKLLKSFEYSALDHKWVARDYLQKQGWTAKKLFKNVSEDKLSLCESVMLKIALSAFRYYYTHYDNITQDQSLSAVTALCSSGINSVDIDSNDSEVRYLSREFNRMVNSKRKLLQCYDCGTNARAVFLKLIEVSRGISFPVTIQEQARMQHEYQVNKSSPLTDMQKCESALKRKDGKNLICILSVSIENFGHVWVIEKKYFSGKPRYHQYQSALGSHMLIDFIESMDYGSDPMNSLDIDTFFSKLGYILSKQSAWKEEDYRMFVELFAFMPVSEIKKPEPGFCWTWIAP